jgi:endo-1,4-beta-D-glucanase Y
VVALAGAQSKPFPQAQSFTGCIKPGVSQQAMNDEVYDRYQAWKAAYLRETKSTQGGYYILKREGASDQTLTVSEAHGYGMIIFALMAGKDPDAKKYFDGMYKIMRAYPISNNADLMAWRITGQPDVSENLVTSEDDDNTATDGDLDMAYALLLAHVQWGSDGAINYLQTAQDMLYAIRWIDIDRTSTRLKLGSWQESSDPYSTRSSDWMPGHLRTFNKLTNESVWLEAADTIYSIVKQVRGGSTGLLPDFVVDNPPKPAAPDFLEGTGDGSYYWNACRDPWRIAMDYAHWGSADAKEELSKLMDWLLQSTGGNPGQIHHGYHLDGSGYGNDWLAMAYVSCFMSGAVVDAKYQDFLDKGWNMMTTTSGDYFATTLNVLNMLFISGNWWKPEVTTAAVMPGTSAQRAVQPIDLTLNGRAIRPLSFARQAGQPGTIGIFTLEGRLLAQAALTAGATRAALTTATKLPNGTYVARLTSRGATSSQRFVLAR